ncbi:MAG: sigma 54-interacting transcriptional regulator [Patescibacteria group bacterium]|nr:sigma 54-interacting transcriptional regulator [Patescibacteria group bacterium]
MSTFLGDGFLGEGLLGEGLRRASASGGARKSRRGRRLQGGKKRCQGSHIGHVGELDSQCPSRKNSLVAAVWTQTMRVIAHSTVMREVARRMERAALADCPVLIWGEEGSGRTFVAETIHTWSRRADGPLVIVRPRAPGGEGGAQEPRAGELRGARGAPDGLAEAAGGTLLISEITELPRTAQASLLGAAEGRGAFADNDACSEHADFRLMATTRFDPAESVRRGTLREDLHYRIGVVAIHVPPLSERTEDLPELIRDLLTQQCDETGTPLPDIEPEFVQCAADYSWPGNVAQLRACLDAMMQAGDVHTLSAHRLQAAIAEVGECLPTSPASPHVITLARLERAAVIHALEVHEGNRTQAARSLGISVRTLQRKLRCWQA